MKVLLGKTKLSGNARTVSMKTTIPLVVQENLHVTEGQEIFLYFKEGRVYLETSKKDESSYGLGKDICFLGSKTLVNQGSVLAFSFANVLREVLMLSIGDYLGYYFSEGRIYIKKYEEGFS